VRRWNCPEPTRIPYKYCPVHSLFFTAAPEGSLYFLSRTSFPSCTSCLFFLFILFLHVAFSYHCTYNYPHLMNATMPYDHTQLTESSVFVTDGQVKVPITSHVSSRHPDIRHCDIVPAWRQRPHTRHCHIFPTFGITVSRHAALSYRPAIRHSTLTTPPAGSLEVGLRKSHGRSTLHSSIRFKFPLKYNLAYVAVPPLTPRSEL